MNSLYMYLITEQAGSGQVYTRPCTFEETYLQKAPDSLYQERRLGDSRNYSDLPGTLEAVGCWSYAPCQI